MSELTGEDCEAAFVVALQNNSAVTTLLPGGKKGIGVGTVTTGTAYPYILISHTRSHTLRVMGYSEVDAESVVHVTVYAQDKKGVPAKQVINALHKAVIACLNQDNSLSITGRTIDRPVYQGAGTTRTQKISDSQIISWSDEVWNIMSFPNP